MRKEGCLLGETPPDGMAYGVDHPLTGSAASVAAGKGRTSSYAPGT